MLLLKYKNRLMKFTNIKNSIHLNNSFKFLLKLKFVLPLQRMKLKNQLLLQKLGILKRQELLNIQTFWMGLVSLSLFTAYFLSINQEVLVNRNQKERLRPKKMKKKDKKPSNRNDYKKFKIWRKRLKGSLQIQI